jgi:hypothetical protein
VDKNEHVYDPVVELAKGADLSVASYDKTQAITTAGIGKVTVGGKPGSVAITGAATGKGAGIDGTINIWLSIFRFMRPDGTINHVAGWNIALALKPGQSPLTTAQAFEAYINSGTRPYKAAASAAAGGAALAITYQE